MERAGPKVTATVASFEVAAEAYSGPIPPPALLERFNDIIPDGANRIMVMAEKQADHRIAIETKVITHDLTQSRLGLAAGTVMGVSLMALAAYMASLGQGTQAAGVVTATLVSLVSTFLYATSSRRGERISKWNQLTKTLGIQRAAPKD